MSKAGMEIHLEAMAGPGLRAVLRNNTGGDRAVLHSANLQPSRVILTGSSGKEITPFDERTRRKFDRTVRASMFKRVPTGGELELGSQQFRKVADRLYELRWGPYHYREVPAGDWTASIIFECKIDKPSDGGHVPNAWSGKAVSNPVNIRLD
jgi:hypothetical protein